MSRVVRFVLVSLLLAIPCLSRTSSKRQVMHITTSRATRHVPAAFRGVPFGASIEQAQRRIGNLSCFSVQGADTTPDHASCLTTDPAHAFIIGNVVIDTEYLFADGKFVGVTFRDGPGATKLNRYHTLVAHFTARLGKPTEKQRIRTFGTNDVLTASGQVDYDRPFEYETHAVTWQSRTVSVALVEGTPGRLGSGHYVTRAWQRALEQTIKRRKASD